MAKKIVYIPSNNMMVRTMIRGDLEGNNRNCIILRQMYLPAGTNRETRTLDLTVSKRRSQHRSRQIYF
jgi:hypothetical protein